jgi:hypothetical protein
VLFWESGNCIDKRFLSLTCVSSVVLSWSFLQLLAADPALKRFKSHKKSVWRLKRVADVATIVVVAGTTLYLLGVEENVMSILACNCSMKIYLALTPSQVFGHNTPLHAWTCVDETHMNY